MFIKCAKPFAELTKQCVPMCAVPQNDHVHLRFYVRVNPVTKNRSLKPIVRVKIRALMNPFWTRSESKHRRTPLRWRHNEHDGVSNQQSRHCSLNRYSGADQRKHQSSFVRGINRWPVTSPHKGPATRKIFPFNDVFMNQGFWRINTSVD